MKTRAFNLSAVLVLAIAFGEARAHAELIFTGESADPSAQASPKVSGEGLGTAKGRASGKVLSNVQIVPDTATAVPLPVTAPPQAAPVVMATPGTVKLGDQDLSVGAASDDASSAGKTAAAARDGAAGMTPPPTVTNAPPATTAISPPTSAGTFNASAPAPALTQAPPAAAPAETAATSILKQFNEESATGNGAGASTAADSDTTTSSAASPVSESQLDVEIEAVRIRMRERLHATAPGQENYKDGGDDTTTQ